jgi:RNA polymerase sigma factor (sigma-70 family)
MEDRELLRQYAEHHSESAFTELVSRHVNIVYSTALRMVCDPHLAKDVAQTVFISLAQKPQAIRDPDALSSWLYRAARNAALQTIRTERRRLHRETEAVNLAAIEDSSPVAWAAVGPHLDEALDQLKDVDLDVVVLRFFEGKSLRETGEALAMSENAVQKRVTRALDKMRAFFLHRGVTASASLLTTLIAANSVQAAPPGLAASLASASLAGVGHAGTAGSLVGHASSAGSLAGNASLAGSVARTIYMTAKTKLLLTAAVVILAAAIPVALQYQTIGQLNEKLADADTKAKTDTKLLSKNEAEIKRLQGELEDFRVLMAGSGGNGGAPADQSGGAPGSNGSGNPANAQSSLAKGLSDMMSDPAMKDIIASQAKSQAETEFADLMKRFNLSPDEKDQFLKLLTDEKMNEVNLGLKLMDTNLSPDDSAALAQQLKDGQASSDAQIKTFLNNDADFATYQLYAKQAPERMSISALSAGLAQTDEPLTPAQSDALTDLMYQERTNFQFSDSLSGDDSTTTNLAQKFQQLTPEAIDSHLQQEQQLQDQIATKAAAVLSPAQLTVFKQTQASTMKMEKMGLQMAQAMMGPHATTTTTSTDAAGGTTTVSTGVTVQIPAP